MASALSAAGQQQQQQQQERAVGDAERDVRRMAASKDAVDDMIRVLSVYDAGDLYPLSSPAPGREQAHGRGQEEDEEETFVAAEDVIRRCSSTSSSCGAVTDDYLYAVDDAIAVAALQGGLASRAAEAVHAAMPRLEEEVLALLSSSSSSSSSAYSSATPRLSSSSSAACSPDHDLGDDDAITGGGTIPLSPRAAVSVRAVADRMLRAGYGPELAQLYVAARRGPLAESAARMLGAAADHPLAIEDVLRMEWPALDQRIRRWNHGVRPVVRTLMAGERLLCAEVFASDSGAENLGRECFADVCRGPVLQLLGFADAVAMCPRATEKLYRTLGMYEALADVAPDLQALFSSASAGDEDEDGTTRELVAGEASAVAARLGATLRRTVEEFVAAIAGESSRRPVAGGEIHPMTRYVLNYCGLLADCRATLDTVLLLDPDDNPDDEDAINNEARSQSQGAPSTPSGRCMRELLTRLLGKMDEKSELYDDAGLKNIFLMNNLYYVTQKVMDSPPLRELLGDDWIRRHRGQIRQYETAYLRASWTAALSSLRDDSPASPHGGSSGSGGRASSASREKDRQARGFNAAFEELYRSQTAWKVSDPQLREELRIAVSERLIPAYRSFLGRPRPQPARHVKYSLEDLENYMLDFFEGAHKFVR